MLIILVERYLDSVGIESSTDLAEPVTHLSKSKPALHLGSFSANFIFLFIEGNALNIPNTPAGYYGQWD